MTTLKAPSGTTGTVQGRSGSSYVVASDGTISNVNSADVLALIQAGWRLITVGTRKVMFSSPLPAELVSVSAAAIATNRALTIAAQPAHARKLQVRIVIVTAITAGNLAIVGHDQDGNAITENVSLIASVTATLKTSNAFADITSATVTGLVGGGDGTLGIGLSNDFGLPTGVGIADLAVVKATKITRNVVGSGTAVTTWTNTAADDVASTGTLDTTARTFAPTTAPAANGLVDFEFSYVFTQ